VSAPDDDTFDEVREAANAVIASLKWLIDATERVVQDPAAFAQAVDGGKSVVEAFVGGFAAHASGDFGSEEDTATTADAESGRPVDES
jgi:hypothetical protein